jgi:dolichol-phosphate mannosyltransferase
MIPASGTRSESLVVLPTYNERENLESAVSAIVSRAYDVLIVDDNSPDGTGALADEIASSGIGVQVLHRPRKLGIGSAYLAGFAVGLNQGYKFILEMDADGSHQADDLNRLIDAARQANGVAIGSRYVRGGGAIGWSLERRILSRAANLYCRILLGRRLRDWTSGYRCYAAGALQAVGLGTIRSDGFSFQIELAHECLRMGIPVVEVPIWFKERVRGKSKASDEEIAAALKCVVRLRQYAQYPSAAVAARLETLLPPDQSHDLGAGSQRVNGHGFPETAVIGVLAHNEEATIGACLRAILAELNGSVEASSVVVVASGCTDRTEDIVRALASEDSRVRLIAESQRSGKVAAINVLLHESTEPLVVVLGGDMVFTPGSLARLLYPFKDPLVGMTGVRPIPTNPRTGIVGNAVNILWEIHHELSILAPKLGEAIAFRRVLKNFDDGTVFDEATMEYLILSRGMRLQYVPEAIVRNRGPENIQEYLKHRSRNIRGHLALKSATGHRVSTLNNWASARASWRLWRRGTPAVHLCVAIALEAIAASHARLSRLRGRPESAIWHPITTSKRVVASGHVLRTHHDAIQKLIFLSIQAYENGQSQPARPSHDRIRQLLRRDDQVLIDRKKVAVTFRGDADAARVVRARLQATLFPHFAPVITDRVDLVPVTNGTPLDEIR